jgi:hypothetical protein
MVCPPATSEAEARWPRFGLVVDATTGRRDNKDQMIRPIKVQNRNVLRGKLAINCRTSAGKSMNAACHR